MTQSSPNSGAPTHLVLATGNRHKIDELASLLGTQWTISGLDALGVTPAEETGTTFEANAILKAEAVVAQTGLPALADDSGLEVDALDGAPGVYSARYAGPHHDDADNRRLLLRNMEPIPQADRACRFVCVIAFARPGHRTVTVRGTCEGSVGTLEAGDNGFGYDSLFVLPDGRTMAQLDADEKNRISHRAVAMREIQPVLNAFLERSVSPC